MNRSLFAGSATLLRFAFRRDRIRLAVWLVGLVLFAIIFLPVFESLLDDEAGLASFAAVMENPAMVVIVGPAYGLDNYDAGAMYGNMMLLFCAMIAGVMNIFFITRHTRQDEEQGRLEVVRSLPVGRLSNLSSALLAALIINAILAIATGLGMYALRAEGMDLNGCMLFGAVMGVTGLLFAAATALFCQLTANNRTASGMSFILLLVLYMLRAVGDMGTEILSLISPLGLILRTETLVNNIWWPVLVVLGASVVLAAAAFTLSRVRDLGRGLLPERPGRSHASRLLSSPLGLALRLLRSAIIIWSISVFVLAAMYGSVFGDMEGFIESNEMIKRVFVGDASAAMLEQFIVKLMAIMSMIAVVPVLSFANRAAGEERQGYAEHIFGRAVSRRENLAAYLVLAFVMSIVFQMLTALGFWAAGSAVLDTAPGLDVFMVSALAYLPAIWVTIGISAVLTAFAPQATFINYIYLGYSFISVYLGGVIGFPEWTLKLTPFGMVPEYPVQELTYTALAIMTAVTALLVLAGFIGYRRRDMRAQ